jgi:hypothetical protein
MFRNAPLAVTTQDLDSNPAARAWAAVGGSRPARIALLRKAHRSKPSVHRLSFDGAGLPAVFAKQFHAAGLSLERRIYESVLPRLPVTAARYRGAWEDDEGSSWLFVEDVGERCLSPGDPAHRVLAARWLGMLHRSAADVVADEPLPDAGPGRYLGLLAAAREAIRLHSGNRALTDDDRAVLHAVLERFDDLEGRWPRIERACEGYPVTLVHADFQPKNLRIAVTDDGPVLRPIDWETAGRGVPAADLALARGRTLVPLPDLATYGATVRERWPELDAAAIRRLSLVGHVLQALAGIKWSCADLRFESADCLLRPIGSMRHYLAQIAAALDAGAEHRG